MNSGMKNITQSIGYRVKVYGMYCIEYSIGQSVVWHSWHCVWRRHPITEPCALGTYTHIMSWHITPTPSQGFH